MTEGGSLHVKDLSWSFTDHQVGWNCEHNNECNQLACREICFTGLRSVPVGSVGKIWFGAKLSPPPQGLTINWRCFVDNFNINWRWPRQRCFFCSCGFLWRLGQLVDSLNRAGKFTTNSLHASLDYQCQWMGV